MDRRTRRRGAAARAGGGLVGVCDGFVGAVGNTPLIRLRRLSAETGCEILGKAEFMNPGGSVKDRAAAWIVLDAERRGLLKPGGTVVEGTAGNTGIGLAHVCRARGYPCVIVMPDNQAAEKYQIVEALGIKLERTKCKAMEGLIEEGAKVIGEEGVPEIIDALLISAAQRVEHYEIAGYGSARTFAELLGEDDAVTLLQQTLDEESETNEKLTKLAEGTVNPAAQTAGVE